MKFHTKSYVFSSLPAQLRASAQMFLVTRKERFKSEGANIAPGLRHTSILLRITREEFEDTVGVKTV
jgi:hypothetical protein